MCFIRTLSCLLIAQFSGIPVALAALRAAKPASEVEALQDEGNRVSKELARLIFEARNPNTLSTGPSNPARLRARAETAEASFLTFKGKLEAYLASHAAVANDEGAEGSAVTFYFEQAIRAVQLRALTSVDGKVEFPRYDFRVPYKMLERMSGFEQAATSEVVLGALADPNSMIALDRASVRSATGELAAGHPVTLQIGRAFAERFVLVAKGGLSDERAFLTVVKSFAVTALLDQWEQIDQVRKTPTHDLPSIPAVLASELGALGQPAQARSQRDLLAQEPERRGAMVSGYSQWWFENDKKEPKPDLRTLSKAESERLRKTADASRALGLEFSNMDLLEGYLSAALGEIPNTAENQEKKAVALESMRMAENAFIRIGLSQAMLGFPLPLEGMNQVELRRALRKILAQAKFVSILPALQQLPAPEEKDAAIDSFLTGATASFGSKISDRALDLWIAASTGAPGAARAQAHKEYVEQMLAEAASLDHDPKAVANPATEADFEIVKRIGRMTPEYRSLRDSARGDLEIVLTPKDWGTSLQAYRLLLTKIAQRESAALAAKEAAKVRSYVEEAKALRAAAPHFALRESGPVDGKLTLGELTEADRAAYLGMSDSTRLNNSLLTVELVEKTPLFKQLAALGNGPAAFAPAEAFLERGFEVLRGNIRADLDQLGKVSLLEPKVQIQELLPLIARSTLLKMQIPKAFPMLTDQLDAAVDNYLSGLHRRGIFAEAKEAFMRPMSGLMFVFLTKLALMAFRPTRPLARAVTALEVGINLETKGYMLAALPILLADVGVDYAEYKEARHDEAETRRWFATSAEASSFYDYFSVADSESRTQAAWSQFSSTLTQQLLFIGVPILAGLAKPSIVRAFDGWKLKKFERLGFSGPEIEAAAAAAQGEAAAANGAKPFTWNKQEIQARARAKIEELRKSEMFTMNRQAREKRIQADADSLVRFIERQEKTARLMIQDLAREYRALGIPRGKETLNLHRLTEAKTILESRYRNFELGLRELEEGRKAFDQIVGGVQAAWGSNVSPIRYLFFKLFRGGEPPRGRKEAFRSRLYAEVFGFTDYGPRDAWWGAGLETKDFYGALGLNVAEVRAMKPEAADAAIKTAYRKAARDTHPDLHPGDAVAEERFKAANEAYGVLSDPVKKTNYDAFLDRAGSPKGKGNP